MWQTTDRTRVTWFDVNFHFHELDGVSFSRNKNFRNTCKHLYYSQRWFVAKYITGRRLFVSEYIVRFAGDILGNKSSKNLFLK